MPEGGGVSEWRAAPVLAAVLTVGLGGCVAPQADEGPGSGAGAGVGAAGPEGGTRAVPRGPVAGVLRVHVVDVGQGDGVVWELPGGAFVVYDCGPPTRAGAANPVVARLRALGLPPGGTLHALVASHGHRDHVGGCEDVLREYRVAHLYEAWYEGDDAPRIYAQFRAALAAEGGVVDVLAETPALQGEVTFHAGEAIALPPAATAAGVRAEVLWPPGWVARGWARIAESSVALRLTLGGVAFCFQGDVGREQEQAMAGRLGAAGGGGCDASLVGHHGSRHASDPAWLAAMQPGAAVVSFGANPYGHPASEALCRVQQAGARVFATHRLGTVVLATDGVRVAVAPDGAERADYCLPGADYWTS